MVYWPKQNKKAQASLTLELDQEGLSPPVSWVEDLTSLPKISAASPCYCDIASESKCIASSSIPASSWCKALLIIYSQQVLVSFCSIYSRFGSYRVGIPLYNSQPPFTSCLYYSLSFTFLEQGPSSSCTLVLCTPRLFKICI